jgi:phosphohistidine phosphatase SixA
MDRIPTKRGCSYREAMPLSPPRGLSFKNEEDLMVMRIVRWVSMFAFLAFVSGPTSSEPAPSEAEWINALHNGGFVIVFRHGATNQDQADTDPLNPKNIVQQRQLNDDGRALAKSIGESLSKLRIPVGQVHTSLFQRAIDTGAMMGFGEVRMSVDYTEGGLVVTQIENNRRAAALRKIVATVPPPGTNVIVVTHKPNILDAFGKDWFDVREGEASVFKPDGNGGYKPIIRIQASAWSELAKDADSFLNLYDLN